MDAVARIVKGIHLDVCFWGAGYFVEYVLAGEITKGAHNPSIVQCIMTKIITFWG